MSADDHYLDGHEYRVDAPSWVPYCTCGWTADEVYDARAYDEHIVAVVLDHERPRIEAEIRESIATEIEAEAKPRRFLARDFSGRPFPALVEIARAARIARGGDQ